VQGANPAVEAEIKTVSAPSLSDANYFGRPEAISVATAPVRSGQEFVVSLPKHSVSVITLDVR
jgi:alpha-L-arabinofuranosidase